jgi:hypothetical protein
VVGELSKIRYVSGTSRSLDVAWVWLFWRCTWMVLLLAGFRLPKAAILTTAMFHRRRWLGWPGTGPRVCDR